MNLSSNCLRFQGTECEKIKQEDIKVVPQFPGITYPEISRLAVPLIERDYSASILSSQKVDPD